MKRALALVRLCWAIACFAVALLALAPAPTYRAWQLAILATEAGVWLIPLALLPLLPGWKKTVPGRVAAGLGVSAVLLLLSTFPRATRASQVVESEFASVFPASGAEHPFRVAGLLSFERTTIVPATFEFGRIATQPLLLDFYRPGKPKAPLVVVIHGGAWSGGDRLQLTPLNSTLARHGYAVASIEYRLAPANTYPAAVEDIVAALAFLKTHADSLGVDPTRIALLGRSAGGHLALLTAYARTDPSVRGVISFYGPTDLRWGWEHPARKLVLDSRATLRGFLGGSLSERPATFDSASPINFTARGIPTLLIHGTRDELVSVHNSEMLIQKLQSRGVPFVFVKLPWATHGCDYFQHGPCGQISTWAVERFLSEVLR